MVSFSRAYILWPYTHAIFFSIQVTLLSMSCSSLLQILQTIKALNLLYCQFTKSCMWRVAARCE